MFVYDIILSKKDLFIMSEFNIKEIREKTGLSQAKFAKKYHITKKSILNWEQGCTVPPEYAKSIIPRLVELEPYDASYEEITYDIDEVLRPFGYAPRTKIEQKLGLKPRTLEKWVQGTSKTPEYVLYGLKKIVEDLQNQGKL